MRPKRHKIGKLEENMSNTWEKAAGLLCLCALLAGMTGCAKKKEPISLTVWTYYNGEQLGAFNEAVEAFNATEGKDNSITVTASSLGSVDDLEQNVIDAVQGKVGAQEVPDIFSAYADTAYAVDSMSRVADLGPYLTDKDKKEYIESYITEGDFKGDGSVKVFPVAKATELLVVNDTDWQKFAEATGTSADEFATVEGLTAMAQRYYEWTDSLTETPNDGKALFGRDAMANYMIIGAKQLGCDVFKTKDGQTTVNLPRDVAKRLWDNYYVPYVKGYFASSGRFRSDDMKTGNVLAFVGSSAGCTFFPDHVTSGDDESYSIEVKTYPAPKFEGGEDYAVQQGAGMVVIRKSDEQVEAAARFLKWFTQSDWAVEFSVSSGYLPVTVADNDMAKIEKGSPNMKKGVRDSLKTAVQVVQQNTLYTTKVFETGTAARKKLEYSMSDAAQADRQSVVEAMENGATLEEAAAEFVSEERFDAWYAQIMTELNEIVGQ
mgnify:CR=1 FL=1